MTVQTEFADLLTDTITVEPKTSIDAYGRRAYSTAVTYSARLMDSRKPVRTAEGRDVVPDGKFVVLGNPAITVEDKITVAGDRVNVLRVDDNHDERGAHHTTVYYGAGGS